MNESTGLAERITFLITTHSNRAIIKKGDVASIPLY